MAHNYQQLHAKLLNEQQGVTSRDPGVMSRDQLQVHCGEAVLLLHSARDVITKVTCRRVLVLDEDLVDKPREFPLSRWRGVELSGDPQILMRMELNAADLPVFDPSTSVDETQDVDDVTCPAGDDVINSAADSFQMNCEVETSSLVASLRDRTLEGLAVFFEPDPTISGIPLTLSCRISDCHVDLQVGTAQQKVLVQGIRVKLNQDESWEIGEDQTLSDELGKLRIENEVLREKLRLLSMQLNCTPDR